MTSIRCSRGRVMKIMFWTLLLGKPDASNRNILSTSCCSCNRIRHNLSNQFEKNKPTLNVPSFSLSLIVLLFIWRITKKQQLQTRPVEDKKRSVIKPVKLISLEFFYEPLFHNPFENFKSASIHLLQRVNLGTSPLKGKVNYRGWQVYLLLVIVPVMWVYM